MLRRLIGTTGALLVLAFATVIQAETVNRPELNEPVTVIRDANGIAHIQAQNEYDLYFMQGYIHAQDRLFQMDLTRRQAEGTLSEIFGPVQLGTDVTLRTLGLARAAEKSLDAILNRTRFAAIAYAKGVNAWVSENPLPPEYGVLNVSEFRPWKAVDSIAVAKVIAFGLSFELDTDRTLDLTAYLETLGQQGLILFTQDIFRTQPFTCASAVPDAGGDIPYIPLDSPTADPRCDNGFPSFPNGTFVSGQEKAADNSGTLSSKGMDVGAMRELAQRVSVQFKRSEFLAKIVDVDNFTGSNEWGVTGNLTEGGLPLVANDPHLSLDTPSTFYPIHLKRPDSNIYGSSFPGSPFVILGHNRHIQWGATVNPMDVTDVFLELVQFDESGLPVATIFQNAPEPVQIIPEAFFVNDGAGGLQQVPPGDCPLSGCQGVVIPPATFVVPRRNNGPIVQFFNDMADEQTGLVPALSVQYTGFSATREADAFRLWNQARDLNGFENGLQYFDFGSQNWVVGTARGQIAYYTSAENPIRTDLQMNMVAPGTVPGFFPPGVPIPPWFVRDGTSGMHEWLPVQNPQPGQAIPFEIMPMDEMPGLINPPKGYYVNANNDPVGTTLDNDPLNQLRPGGQGLYYLNPGYDGFRAGAITLAMEELIEANGQLSFEDMQAVQADVRMIDARYFVPWILQAFDRASAGGASAALAEFAADERIAEAVERLSNWNYAGQTGTSDGNDFGDEPGSPGEPDEEEIANSVATTIYSVWRGQAVRLIIDDTLNGLQLPGPGSALAMTAMRNLFDKFPVFQGFGASGIDFFPVEGVSREDARDIKLLAALESALDLLAGQNFAKAFGGSTNQDDYRWGRLHRITLDHPFLPWYSIPPNTGVVGPAPGFSVDGGFGVPDASNHSVRADAWNEFGFGSGPSRRYVGEPQLSIDHRTESIWPGGPSGVPRPGNPFYDNLVDEWLVNEAIPTPLRFSDALDGAFSVTEYVP